MGFGYIDLLIVFVYLAGVTAIGVYFRRQKDIHDYFLGGRDLHWWAICLSSVATETSTLTIIGTPAIAYGGSLVFLQVCMGYIVARFVVSFLLLPHYFKGDMLTAYEYIEQRFGGVTRRIAAGLFLVTRALADAVRLWAIAIVVQLVLPRISAMVTGKETEVAVLPAVLVVMSLTLLYTFLGGIKAVIWTDVVQYFIYMIGGIAALWTLLAQIPGGWETVMQTAGDKLTMFDFTFSWTSPYNFWAGVLGGTFLTTASHGTDQLMVQRFLSSRNLNDARKALIVNGLMVFVQFALFLMVGVGLYVFYATVPNEHVFASSDYIFPTYMVTYLPVGISGLMVAGVLAAAMSTSSATLNSLAASTVVDFYQPLAGKELSQDHLLRLSRWVTLGWGALLVGLAYLAQHWGPVLEAGLSIASITYGALLGLFLLGRLVPKATATGAAAGMLTGLAVLIYVKFFTPIGWTWYVLIGTLPTFLVGWAVSILMPQTNSPEENG